LAVRGYKLSAARSVQLRVEHIPMSRGDVLTTLRVNISCANGANVTIRVDGEQSVSVRVIILI
jgi:hypothetical protein